MSDKQQKERTWDELSEMFGHMSRDEIQAYAADLAKQPGGKLTESEIYKVAAVLGWSIASDVQMAQMTGAELDVARQGRG